MKILYVGGTGVISSACVRRCVDLGHDVHVFNRGKRPAEYPRSVTHISGDRKDTPGFRKAFEKATYDAVCDFLSFNGDDARLTLDTFEGRCGQLVFISSTSAYQKPPVHHRITESTPLINPFWDYARGKIAVEDLALAAYRERRYPVTIVRPAYTYGQWMLPGPTGSGWIVAKRILEGRPTVVPGDGQALWTTTFNEDFAVGFAGLLGHPAAIGQAFHITSDEARTWDAILQTVAEALGRKADIVHVPTEYVERLDKELAATWWGDKANCTTFDNTKIKMLVPDFCPRVRLHEGVRRCLGWLDLHPEFKTADAAREASLDRIASSFRAALDAAGR